MIVDGRAKISGRERDVSEVRGYWNALLRVEDWAGKKKPLTEELIKRLHALVEYGPGQSSRLTGRSRTPSGIVQRAL